MASYQGQNLPLGDSDVESEEEYETTRITGQEGDTEEQKRMESLVLAIKNG